MLCAGLSSRPTLRLRPAAASLILPAYYFSSFSITSRLGCEKDVISFAGRQIRAHHNSHAKLFRELTEGFHEKENSLRSGRAGSHRANGGVASVRACREFRVSGAHNRKSRERSRAKRALRRERIHI